MLSVQCEPPQEAQAQNINAGTVGEKNDRYRKKNIIIIMETLFAFLNVEL